MYDVRSLMSDLDDGFDFNMMFIIVGVSTFLSVSNAIMMHRDWLLTTHGHP